MKLQALGKPCPDCGEYQLTFEMMTEHRRGLCEATEETS